MWSNKEHTHTHTHKQTVEIQVKTQLPTSMRSIHGKDEGGLSLSRCPDWNNNLFLEIFWQPLKWTEDTRPPTNSGVDRRRSPPAPPDTGRLQGEAGWWQPEALSVRDTQQPLLLKNGKPCSRSEVKPRNQVFSTTQKSSFTWLREKQTGNQGSQIRTSCPTPPTKCGTKLRPQGAWEVKKGILDPPSDTITSGSESSGGTSYPLMGERSRNFSKYVHF